MKATPFIVVMCILCVAVLCASQVISDVDLTPDTALPTANAPSDSSAPVNTPLTNPSTGTCNSVYTIQSGDTLSTIARQCGVTVDALMAANPSITDPNQISVGQQINIPGGSQASPGEVVAAEQVTATSAPPIVEQPTVEPPPSQPTVEAPAATSPSEIPGVKPGDVLTVEITNLPPQVRVRVGMGPQGGAMTILGETITDMLGIIRVEVTVPPEARPGEIWFVAAMTLEEPYTTVNSAPFQIGGVP